MHMSGLPTLAVFFTLVIFVDCRSTKCLTQDASKITDYDYNCRIWSIATQKYLTIKKINGTLSITFSGTGDEDGRGNEGSSILKAVRHSIPDANLWHYVFELCDNGTWKTYALNFTNNTFTALEVCSNTVDDAITFEPVDFSGTFKALKVEMFENDKCMAGDSDGSLSLKACEKDGPHPGTILVITKLSRDADRNDPSPGGTNLFS